MRLVLVLLLACVVTSSADALPVRVGLDAGLMFRGEAGGNHSVLPTFAPRLAVAFPYEISAVVLWPVAYAGGADGAGAVSTLHHRFIARAEYAYPVGSARFFAGLGAAVVMAHSKIWNGDELYASSVTARGGPALCAGLDVDVSSWRFRLAAESVFAGGRRDLAVVVGTTFPFGESR